MRASEELLMSDWYVPAFSGWSGLRECDTKGREGIGSGCWMWGFAYSYEISDVLTSQRFRSVMSYVVAFGNDKQRVT